jgi:aminoglycoside phosphotransferase (APT) family kinase protein
VTVELRAAHLAPALAARWPEREGLEVTRLRRSVGGISRETWFADLAWTEDGSAQRDTVTIRADHPDGPPSAVDLIQEYRVYRALGPSVVPVPAALWFEDDPAWIGRPFYVREMVPGSSVPKDLFGVDKTALRRTIGEQLARHLGRLHTLDWGAHGLGDFLGVPADPDAAVTDEIARWRRFHLEHRVAPRPVVTELLGWLERHAPRGLDRTSLVWGDVGLGNFIVDGDRIVGLTDWEYAHLDDPMKDWAAAFMRGADSLLPREELFAAYTDESGIVVDEDRIRYHTVSISTQYSILGDPQLRQVLALDGRVDIGVMRTTIGFPHACERDAMAIIRSWPATPS